eukprot:1572212-Rhodomonas_salina.4
MPGTDVADRGHRRGGEGRCRSASVYGCIAPAYGDIASEYGGTPPVYGEIASVCGCTASVDDCMASVYGGASVCGVIAAVHGNETNTFRRNAARCSHASCPAVSHVFTTAIKGFATPQMVPTQPLTGLRRHKWRQRSHKRRRS